VVRVESPRGAIQSRARISGIREGVVFAPFHYGYFDRPGGDAPNGHARAANELTITEWDPVSKQPLFKVGAVRVTKVADADGTPSQAPTNTASAPPRRVGYPRRPAVPRPKRQRRSRIGVRVHLANYLGYLHAAELHLAEAYRKVGKGHAAESDVFHTCNTLAKQCEAHAGMLGPFVDRYGEERPTEPDRLYHELFDETRSGGLGSSATCTTSTSWLTPAT
jgi:molydopterin dinucleotide binding protein